MGRPKKGENGREVSSSQNIVTEIWGIIYCAIGLLVLIALISSYSGSPDNILGPFGTFLSQGLFYLLGPVTAILIPIAVIAVGIFQIKEKNLSVKGVVIWVLLSLELCVVTAIHKLPRIAQPDFDFSEFLSINFLGSIITRGLYVVFGRHPFGPYFLFILAIVLTILAAFNVKIKDIFAAIHQFTTNQIARIHTWYEEFKLSREVKKIAPEVLEQLDISEGQSATEPAAENAPKKKSKNLTETPENEEVQKEEIDEDLAAFRAKKEEPVNIITPEISESEKEFAREKSNSEEVPINSEVEEIIEYDDEEEVEEEDVSILSNGSFKPTKPKKSKHPYTLPPFSILSDPPKESKDIDKDKIQENSRILEKTLLNFSVEGKVTHVSTGPVINRYEIALAPGIKVSKVVNLQDDISMAVGGQKIRIQAPIPGKAAIGIELPNPERQIVHFKHILQAETFTKSKAKLPIIIGRNIAGMPFVTDIAKMPHLLIAGQTGSGKSVCINSIICSLLMIRTPEELRMIMIDPKKVELAYYEGIPHLLSPVVTESKEAVKALQWGVIEMERRYRLLAKVGARNLESFNTRLKAGKIPEGTIDDDDNKPLPFIVILVDELADLMMTASKDVEGLIQRIAQLARAVGIHLIVATQRPSVDIITGPIKANLTSRIGFRTIQSTDSRTILGHVGAEKLLGMGDMLFLRNGAPDIERFHGAFISEEDVESLVTEIKGQYVDIEKIESFEKATSDAPTLPGINNSDADDRDELFVDAAEIIVNLGQGSTSLLQRRMKIGYARAGRLMDELERAGIVGPQDGSKAREVFIMPEELKDHLEGVGVKL